MERSAFKNASLKQNNDDFKTVSYEKVKIGNTLICKNTHKNKSNQNNFPTCASYYDAVHIFD